MKEKIRSMLLRANYWAEHIVDVGKIEDLLVELKPKVPVAPLIRVGAPADGGYLLPDDLEGITACISPGVFNECSFDLDLAERGLDVHMADASVDGPPVAHPRFRFSKLFLDTYNSEDTVTLADFCKDVTPGQDLIMEMDIEGAEYRVLQSASDDLLNRFRIIVIEIHFLNSLFLPIGFMAISTLFRRLLRTHNIVHVHPNNAVAAVSRGPLVIAPCTEFTFYRKDRPIDAAAEPLLPHPLDTLNVQEKPDIVLPDLMLRGRGGRG